MRNTIPTPEEIERAQRRYQAEVKPYLDRLHAIYNSHTPKIIVTNTEVKCFYEENEETEYLRERINNAYAQIKAELEGI